MKRNFSKTSNREKIDKVEKMASFTAASRKEKSSKRRLSIYDEFDDEEMDDFDTKLEKHMKSRK
jgi:hypothetical protein